MIAKLEEVKTAVTMVHASGMLISDCLAAGASGRVEELLRAWFRVKDGLEEESSFIPEIHKEMLGMRARIVELRHIQWFTNTSVEELVAAIEVTAVTSYLVPEPHAYPNWINVASGLHVVGKMMRAMGAATAGAARTSVVAKLRQVLRGVFNSRVLRFPKAEHVANRQEERAKHRDFLGEVTDEAVPEHPDFVSVVELQQTTLREILMKHAWLYQLLFVEGDGNCFFRAIIQGLTPHIPRDYEDAYSLELRKLSNSAAAVGGEASQELKGFEVDDESDSSTMARPGVWADHVQIAKVGVLLQRQVWLIRCDDSDLKMDESGVLVPSEHYQIGPSESRFDPLVLFYQTSPGHFETLANKIRWERSSVAEVLGGGASTMLDICICFFLLEQGQSALESTIAGMSAASFDYDVRQAIQGEIQERKQQLEAQLKRLRSFLGQIHQDKRTDLLEDVTSIIYGDLLSRLFADSENGPLHYLASRLHESGANLIVASTAAAAAPPPSATTEKSPQRPVPPQTTSPSPSALSGHSIASLVNRESVDDWKDFFLLNESMHTTDIKGLTMKGSAISALYKSLEILRDDPRGKTRRTKLCLTDCELDCEACEILKGKPPQLLTHVTLIGCKFPPEYVVWFKVKGFLNTT